MIGICQRASAAQRCLLFVLSNSQVILVRRAFVASRGPAVSSLYISPLRLFALHVGFTSHRSMGKATQMFFNNNNSPRLFWLGQDARLGLLSFERDGFPLRFVYSRNVTSVSEWLLFDAVAPGSLLIGTHLVALYRFVQCLAGYDPAACVYGAVRRRKRCAVVVDSRQPLFFALLLPAVQLWLHGTSNEI